jgi:ABC-2 type transport system permease protein
MPLSMLPPFIGTLAPLWPAYHLAQLALAVGGQEFSGSIVQHVLALVAFTAVCFGIARRWLARRA